MRRIHDLRCLSCERIETNVLVEGEEFPACGRCGGARDWIPSQVRTDIWGAPTYIKSLDREFSGKGELRAYLKENGLQEAGDKVNFEFFEDAEGLPQITRIYPSTPEPKAAATKSAGSKP